MLNQGFKEKEIVSLGNNYSGTITKTYSIFLKKALYPGDVTFLVNNILSFYSGFTKALLVTYCQAKALEQGLDITELSSRQVSSQKHVQDTFDVAQSTFKISKKQKKLKDTQAKKTQQDIQFKSKNFYEWKTSYLAPIVTIFVGIFFAIGGQAFLEQFELFKDIKPMVLTGLLFIFVVSVLSWPIRAFLLARDKKKASIKE